MQNTPKHNMMITAGLNLIQQALSIFDSDLRLVLMNRPMQKMFSLPDALVTPGARFDTVIRYLAEMGEYGPIDDLDGFVQARVDLALAFEPHYMERTRANGHVISVEGAPLPEGGWVTVYTDITETKRQEALLRTHSEALSDQVLARSEELSQSNRALASANAALEETKDRLTRVEQRTRLTTQMMPAHIAHLDMDRHYTFSNQRLDDIISVSNRDIVGLHAREALGEEAYSEILPNLERAYEGHPSVFEFTHAPTSHRVRVAFTPDFAEAGGVQGVYILSMDVTEETQARVALQQTRRREIAAQLTSGMAHDFSNLLTIILGMQSKLSKMPDLPGKAEPLISATLSAARRGGSLLERIGDATGPKQAIPTPVSLTDLLAEFETMARPSLSARHRLNIENLAGAQPYNIDPGFLLDSLLNLVLNAKDAMPDGGQINITVRRVQDIWLEVEVADSGPGFDEATLPRAFDPFFTTKGDHGTGLGLAMVYDMTKLAGGDVEAFNDEGAHVVLRLPLRVADQPVAPGLILLVEDSEDLRATIRDDLVEVGHMVLEATSVHEAEMLLQSVPDITCVLSDIQLAGTRTGLDLRGLTTRPLTLMTSLPKSDPLFIAAQQSGPVVQKPYRLGDLIKAMAQAQTLQQKDHAHE